MSEPINVSIGDTGSMYSTNSPVEMNNNPVSLLFNLTGTAVDSLKGITQRGILLANQEKIQQRMDICYKCNCLDIKTVRCKLCGCFMKIKVRLDGSKCPAHKW